MTGSYSAISRPTLPLPTLERVAAIADGVRAWLLSILERIPAEGDIVARALCQLLVTFWIANRMIGGSNAGSPAFADVASRTAAMLKIAWSGGKADPVNPFLKLLAQILLSSESVVFHPLAEFLERSASALQHSDASLRSDPSLMEKWVLLSCAGVLPLVHPNVALPVLQEIDLSASAEEIATIALRLESFTGWGTRPVAKDVIPQSLTETVAGFAVQRFRKYDLKSGARLLKIHGYLALDCRDDLTQFLCLCHQPSGPFGWYGPESSKMRRLDSDFRAELEISLPTTLECLWTLAERTLPDWRLFDQVPRYAL